MNRRMIPLFLMLLSGVVTAIITMIQKDSMLRRVLTLFIVMLVFCILGYILKWTLDLFDSQNRKRQEAEEKEAEKREAQEQEQKAKEAENEANVQEK